MPEFNRNFAKGKMNKDLDERLVPAGQYRDALNVQVSTSDGSNVGSLENILGNTEVSVNIIPEGGYCVGSIVDNEVNCIYYLVAGNEFNHADGNVLQKNYIIKYNIDENNFTFVFVDIYKVTTNLISFGLLEGLGIPQVKVSSSFGIRKGMSSSGIEVQAVDIGEGNSLLHDNESFAAAAGLITFTSRSVLSFNRNTDITAINIVEDLLMYTDNVNEPKTVNIKRSILGTGSDNDALNISANNSGDYHTRLVSRRKDGSFVDDGFEVVTNFSILDSDVPVYSELENNTTIRKSPLAPPTLRMSASSDNRSLRVDSPYNPTSVTETPGGPDGGSVTLNNPFIQLIGPFGEGSTQFPTSVVGTGATIEIVLQEEVSFEAGDFILITSDTSQNPLSFTDFDIRAQVLSVDPNDASIYTIQITTINPELGNSASFFVILEQSNSLFEFKFPRFSYRYKYVDGQYSPFAPFSEIAFLPGPFDHYPKEGYNLGMVNRLRSLRVENYAPHPSERPKDITEIDVLYKEDKSTTVYTVKTIKQSDGQPLWPLELGLAGYSVGAGSAVNDGLPFRGSLKIESELIHAVVPANQLLRPWDNVPRKALAQEVSANRLIYGNYIQNYNVVDVSNNIVTPELGLSLNVSSYADLGTQIETPTKSIKSQRTYQLGVVYKDEFGRETPVLADKEGGSISIAKEFCNDSTSFVSSIKNNAPAWAKSFKFFIKETSNEYYNMAMDRWYHAEDGNIWISFASSDRNKVDEETFLELKKGHDSPIPVTEPARYKILAIENEAPQDIKLDRDTQGTLTNGTYDTILNAFFGTTGQGFPVSDGNFVTVRANEFNSTFDVESAANVISRASECSLKFQTITGGRTKYYKIIDIVGPNNEFGGAGDGYRITIEGKFDDEVDSICGGSFANRTPGLQLVITHDEFEDKPEFDGKFFVKIFRDATVEQFIMVTNDNDLVVIRGYDMKYLHTYDMHTGGTAGLKNTDNDTSGLGNFPGANTRNDYVRGIAGLNHVHPYNSGYTWADDESVPGNLSEVSNQPNNDGNLEESNGALGNFLATNGGDWGIYKGTWEAGNASEGFEDNNAALLLLTPALLIQYGVALTIADFASDGRAESFWNRYFTKGGQATAFIDDAWALSWAHLPDTIEGGLDGDNTDWHSAPGQVVTNTFGLDLEYTEWNDNASSPNTVNHTSGAPQAPSWAQNGSRGIWSNYMDISITGGFVAPDTHEDDWKDILNDDPKRMDFMDPIHLENGNNQNLYEFMSLLLIPGCKWRWRDDPDKRIHETVDHYRHWGIINAQKTDFNFGDEDYWWSWNRRQKFTIKSNTTIYDARRNANHDGSKGTVLEIMGPYQDDQGFSSENPAIWETKPKEDIGLDIYYEISRAYPVEITSNNHETAILPGYGSLISINGVELEVASIVKNIGVNDAISEGVISIVDGVDVLTGDSLVFNDGYGGEVNLIALESGEGISSIKFSTAFHSSFTNIKLPWNNCYAFGNGVESDRIRDDFNQSQIANGVKASTTIAEQYKEERRSEGLIFSGIFNSISGVNRLNQFIQAEPITKDLEPDNGSIQKLFTRDTDIVTFCEDKVLKVLSDKDAIFEAGGDARLTAANRVLGQAIPFSGDYGISKNPESFAADKYRCYFTDTQRAAVIRLSKDGMTPVSDYGMKDYFTDAFSNASNLRLIGTFDQRKDNYNLTIQNKSKRGRAEIGATITYNEQVKGWVSFKSFLPESGVGVNNNYYTFKNGSMWKHHTNETRNSFYGVNPTDSEHSYVELIFNDAPSSVKNFQTIKYEGTQSRILRHVDDDQYYNLNSKAGWFVEKANSDLQDAKVPEFLNREGKWFNYIKGECTDFNNLDEKEFTVQGIGEATITHSNPEVQPPQPKRVIVKDSSVGNQGQNWI